MEGHYIVIPGDGGGGLYMGILGEEGEEGHYVVILGEEG